MATDHAGGLTRDHVVWAYRLLLDRDPENDDVIGPKLAGSRHTRAAPPPDDVGRVPGQEPRLCAHERPDGDHQGARRPWKRASLCRPVRSCDRSAYRARAL